MIKECTKDVRMPTEVETAKNRVQLFILSADLDSNRLAAASAGLQLPIVAPWVLIMESTFPVPKGLELEILRAWYVPLDKSTMLVSVIKAVIAATVEWALFAGQMGQVAG
jgi:hypothetical protein